MRTGLVAGLGAVQGAADLLRQQGGGCAHRVTPVVGEGQDVVGAVHEVQQVAVGQAQQPRGLDRQGLVHAQTFQLPEGEPGNREPDFVRRVAHRERAAHDARQHEQDWSPSRHARGAACRCNRGCFGQRPVEPPRRLAEQPQQQRVDGDRLLPCALAVLVRDPEVVEVIDVGALVEAVPALGAAQAAVHGTGIDHEVVIAGEEQVRQQELEAPPEPLLLDVAGDDRERLRYRQVRPVEVADQGSARHHRGQAWQGLRIRALLDHGQDQLLHPVSDGAAEERHLGDQERHHRQPAIEPPGGERGSARGAGDAHEALHPRALLAQLRDQLGQIAPVIWAKGAPGSWSTRGPADRAKASGTTDHRPARPGND